MDAVLAADECLYTGPMTPHVRKLQRKMDDFKNARRDAERAFPVRVNRMVKVVLDLEQIISNASLRAHNDEIRRTPGAGVASYVYADVVAALANHGVEIVKPEAPQEPEVGGEAKTAGQIAMDRLAEKEREEAN